ncbi:MAG: aminotransferase class I/II-fold pyridoxal phosphate-dependent enzyme [Treponema sp.]|nr:aminotransferase class I/II-fold pyridoxal phosphate-dependent enzyme [Treponema sp.]MBQ2080844.1 aminotransferase class I/II-fold pyridoxal phosphate-dependent enzyme [Treponema sp.]
MITPLAKELNDILGGTTAGDLLSDVGKRLYFPKGIIAQSGEAKKLGKTANGTIGMTVIGGTPVTLKSIQDLVPGLTARELVAYAPTAGNPDLRALWKEAIIKKNPLLKDKAFSLPVLVPGLTAGISYLADLFLDESKGLIAADPSWDNYVLIASARRNADFVQFAMFKDGKFNIDGLVEKMKEQAKSGSVRVLLNFPQNPSGYSPTVQEAKRLVEEVKSLAENGTKVMVWCDDAYFGLAYEDDIEKQSLFAYLADLHPNVLAAKIDGPTKEDFAWGFRCGFITFASKGMTEEQYDALVKKLMGTIRSSVSCSSTPPQTLLLKAFQNPETEAQKAEYRKVLEKRYKLVKDFVNTHKSDEVIPLPFNSGYFMSFSTKTVDAELLRQTLLNESGIGTISIDSRTLRVAFSSLEEDKIPVVYKAIYETAEKLARS